MSHDHKIVKCRICLGVISQCRCPLKDKQVEWRDTCGKCLEPVTELPYKTAYESVAKERDRYKRVFDALMVIKEELERG